MPLKEPRARAFVLVRGSRTPAPIPPRPSQPERPTDVEVTTEEEERTSRLAAELRLLVVARAGARRLRPANVLYAVSWLLGMAAATAVRDRRRLDSQIEELHRQVRDAADQTFARWETTR